MAVVVVPEIASELLPGITAAADATSGLGDLTKGEVKSIQGVVRMPGDHTMLEDQQRKQRDVV